MKEAHDQYLKELENRRLADQAQKARENDEADQRRRETMENQRKQMAQKNEKKQELLAQKMAQKAENDLENERIRQQKAADTRLREQMREERLENEKMRRLQDGLKSIFSPKLMQNGFKKQFLAPNFEFSPRFIKRQEGDGPPTDDQAAGSRMRRGETKPYNKIFTIFIKKMQNLDFCC